jgi:hypothetical protein
MPMNDKQKKQWFIYHPATDESRHAYEAIRGQIELMAMLIKDLELFDRCVISDRIAAVRVKESDAVVVWRQWVRDWAKSFCEMVDQIIVPCADASTAQRQARLAACRVNKCLSMIYDGAEPGALSGLIGWAVMSLDEASIWANMAIATGGA